MRPEAIFTAFVLDIEDGGLVREVVVMVERDGKTAPLKKLEALTAGWTTGEVVGMKCLEGYLG